MVVSVSAEEDLGLGVELGVTIFSSRVASPIGTRTISVPCSATIVPNVAVGDGVDRVQAETRGQPAVERGRRAAALDVAEHGGPRLVTGARLELTLQQLADAAEPLVAEGVLLTAVARSACPPSGSAPSDDHHDRGVAVGG